MPGSTVITNPGSSARPIRSDFSPNCVLRVTDSS